MISEIFRFEKNAYDPQEVIGAVRDCRYFHQDSTHSRPFFGRTVDQLLLNEYPEEVASLVSVIMGGGRFSHGGLKGLFVKIVKTSNLKTKEAV